jgi:predicted acyl esterase
LVLWTAPGLRAQGLEYVKEHYAKAEYQVPMRDEVRVFTAVYAPKDTSRDCPILLARPQSGIRPYRSKDRPSRIIARMLP